MPLSQTRKMKTTTGKVVKAVVKAVTKSSTPTIAKKVATLQRTVKKLNKISYDKITMHMASDTFVAVTQPVYINHLNRRMDLWTPIFGSNNTDSANADKIYVNSYKFDCRLVQDNEPDRIFYTMFIVSLKDDANDATTFDPATGALTLANGVHYQQLDTAGRVLINQKFFNIHSYKRFYMGGRAGDQSAPESRDLSFKIVPKQKVIVNPRGNVLGNATFTFPKDPSQNYYILLFNDDAGVDLQTNKIYVGGLASVAVPN